MMMDTDGIVASADFSMATRLSAKMFLGLSLVSAAFFLIADTTFSASPLPGAEACVVFLRPCDDFHVFWSCMDSCWTCLLFTNLVKLVFFLLLASIDVAFRIN